MQGIFIYFRHYEGGGSGVNLPSFFFEGSHVITLEVSLRKIKEQTNSGMK